MKISWSHSARFGKIFNDGWAQLYGLKIGGSLGFGK